MLVQLLVHRVRARLQKYRAHRADHRPNQDQNHRRDWSGHFEPPPPQPSTPTPQMITISPMILNGFMVSWKASNSGDGHPNVAQRDQRIQNGKFAVAQRINEHDGKYGVQAVTGEQLRDGENPDHGRHQTRMGQPIGAQFDQILRHRRPAACRPAR